MTDASPSFGALIAVCGLPGVGKTTVAKTLADEVGGTHLAVEEVRADLLDEPRDDPASDAAAEELLDRAAAELDRGNHVILDATLGDSARRAAAEEVAWLAGTEFRLLKVEADEEALADRLTGGDDGTDDRYRAYREAEGEFDPLPDDVTVIDNSGNVSATQQAVRRWVQRSLRSRNRDPRGPGF